MRPFLLALTVFLAGCGSGDDATVAADTDIVVAPADAADTGSTDETADLTALDPTPDASPDAATPAAEAPAGAEPAASAPDPVPAAGPPEEGDEPISAVSDGMLGISNATGRTLTAVHIVGCTESEGNDWNTMETWATDYLGGNALAAGESTMVELVPGCYRVKSILDGGAAMEEEIQTTSGMVYEIEIDV